MRRMLERYLLVAVAVALMSPIAAASGSQAQVIGVVVDASGAPVAGATVANADGTGATHATGPDGRFAVDRSASSALRLRVQARGFADVIWLVEPRAGPQRIVLLPPPLRETVTVTATRGAAGRDTASSTSVVSSAELLTSAAGSIDDALRHTPGFSLFRRSSSRVANPTTQGVTLRGVSGSGASRTLVVADGWALNDAFGSWVYWNRVPLAAIDRVEVVRGAAGDLYGADALGGVIQVLTLDADRPRLRALLDAGSADTIRGSAFGGQRLGGWRIAAGGEWQRTDGAPVIAAAERGPVDQPADADYQTGFVSAGYAATAWRATLRGHASSEGRHNGSPLQVNDTSWRQLSSDLNGTLAGGFWIARGSAGTQDYFQTFSAIAADRRSERLTSDQRVPASFLGGSGQWARTWGRRDVMVGAEARRTAADLVETRFPIDAAPLPSAIDDVDETTLSVFARLRLAPRDDLSVLIGARGDRWITGEASGFLSPRASVNWRLGGGAALQFSASRAYRTPTLNELYRGFRVGNIQTNANPLLAPERLTSVEAGLLVGGSRTSLRVTAFRNVLDDAIANITLSTTPSLTTRERQNADQIRSSGLEVEGDLRPHSRLTITAFGSFTQAEFGETPKQPALSGRRVPQVPRYHAGVAMLADVPRLATLSAQLRMSGTQFEDDLNELPLSDYVVVDASASRALHGGVQLFAAVENLFDTEYDVGRTPVRSIGWPRTFRAGVRLFLP